MEEVQFDPRTKRPVQGSGVVYDQKIRAKDNSRLERVQGLFRDLITTSAYQELKALGFAKCRTYTAPVDVNSAINWHFNAVRRSFMDDLFNDVEMLGKALPDPEAMPIGPDKTRLSFFAENV